MDSLNLWRTSQVRTVKKRTSRAMGGCCSRCKQRWQTESRRMDGARIATGSELESGRRAASQEAVFAFGSWAISRCCRCGDGFNSPAVTACRLNKRRADSMSAVDPEYIDRLTNV